MSLFARWRADRDAQRKAARYVATLFVEPALRDVEWLTQNATRGDVDHATWELRYARRALGLIAAQRDALDDRTASIVAREISEAFARDREHRRRQDRHGGATVQRAAERISRRTGVARRRADVDANGSNALRVRRRQLQAAATTTSFARANCCSATSPRRTRRCAPRSARSRCRRTSPPSELVGRCRRRDRDCFECRRGDSNPHELAPTGS